MDTTLTTQSATPDTSNAQPVTFDLSTAQPVKTAEQATQPAQPVTFDLSTAQPVKTPPPVTFDLSTAQPAQAPSEKGQLARKLVNDLMPEGSAVRKVLGALGQDSQSTFLQRLENLPGAYWHAAKALVDADKDETTWQRIKSVANMPIVSGATNPESALPVVLGDVAENELRKTNHPTLAKIVGAYGGEKKAELDLENSMTSPLNLGIMAATGGLGSVEGAASSAATKLGLSKEAIAMAGKYGPQVARLVNAGFAISGIKSAYDSIPEIKKAFDAGDTQEVARLLTQNAGTLAMSGMAGVHALGSVLPEGVATKEEAATGKGRTQAKPEAEQPQPLSAAPVVKIVDTPLQAELNLGQAKVEAAQQQPTEVAPKEANEPTPAASSKSEGGSSTESAGSPVVGESNAPTGGQSPNAPQVGGNPAATIVPDSFVPAVSRDQILAEATQRIVNNSPILQKILDPTKLQTSDDIDDALNAASEHIETSNDPRVGARIGFEQIKSLARDLNLKPEELMSNPSGTPANAEQVTAARMMLQQSSENVLDLARKAVANPGDSTKADLAAAVAKHQEISGKVRSYAAEAGRALVSHKIGVADVPENKIAEALSKVPKEVLDQATRIAGGLDPNDPNYTVKANQVLKIADALQEVKPETLDLAAKLLSKINPAEPGYISKTNKLIEEITPSTTADKLFEIYRNSLLSSPSTLIKKTASESAALMLEAATKGLTGALEQGKAKLEGRDPDAIAAESYWYAKGAVKAMANARAILSGEFDLANAPGFEESFPRAVKGTVGQLVRLPAETLSRATNLVYALNYFGELESQAARIAKSEGLSGDEFRARQHYLVENPNEEMTQQANETGLHNTFQSELGSTGSKLQALVHSNNALRFLLPFVKTPINLVKMTAEYSPYGALKGTAQGDLTAQARGLIGSSLATGIAYLAGQGSITGGGPTDFRKREAKESTGWQPYSIKIGDKYYRYNRLEPLGLLFSAVADTVHGIMRDEDPAISNAKAASVVDHISRNVQDLPFLMQLSGMLDAMTQLSSKTPERVIDNLLASAVVPAGVKALAQAVDPTMRSPQRNGMSDPMTGLKQTIEERVPGLTKNVEPDIDITGQPVKRPGSELGGANPFPVSVDNKNPITAELARMGVVVGPAPQQVIVRRNGVPITYAVSPEEGQKIQQAEVQQFYQIMSRVISQPGWKAMPDFDKKLVIDSVHKQVTANRLGRLYQLREQAHQPPPTGQLPPGLTPTHYLDSDSGTIQPVQ
jgi:hypothetical protein